jgi:alpha-1,3-glucan synthase
MVFQNSDYDSTALSESGDNLVFTRSALGAEVLRYSVDFRRNLSDWRQWEDTASILKSEFQNRAYFWGGNHDIMNCMLPGVPISMKGFSGSVITDYDA